MTTPTLNGQLIGQAQLATRAVLDQLLAETGTPFVQWVVLNVLATSGGTLPRSELVDRVASGLKVDESDARGALGELVAARFVEDDDSTARLTGPGAARYGQIQAGIDAITARLYGDLPPADLAAAARVLTIVTERANASLAR
jgi:hypothetical protein